MADRPSAQPSIPILIPSIFYHGQPLLNPDGGFSKERASKLVQELDQLAQSIGLRLGYDVLGPDPESLISRLDFMAELTQNLLLVDSESSQARLAAMQHGIQQGLRDRLVYNSLSRSSYAQEIRELESMGARIAIALLHDPSNPLPAAKLRMLDWMLEQKPKLELWGDLAVLDVPSIGLCLESFHLIRSRHPGIKLGCAPCNALLSWKLLDKEHRLDGLAGICGHLGMIGMDFILCGPIEHCSRILALMGIMIGIRDYSLRFHGMKLPEFHPLNRMFRGKRS